MFVSSMSSEYCSRCFEKLNPSCPCDEVFQDFKLHRFSTASVRIAYTSEFFTTIGRNRADVFNYFECLRQSTEKTFPIFQFSATANRKNSSRLQKKRASHHGQDKMYNSAMIRKGYVEPVSGKLFRTSCLIFRNSMIITLGNYNLREEIFRNYIETIRNSLLQFTTFQIENVTTILTNVSFTGCYDQTLLQPPPPPPAKKKRGSCTAMVHAEWPFNLRKTYDLLQPLYQGQGRKIIFDPILQDRNKICIILSNKTGDVRVGKISIFKSGTAMFLGFKKLATILTEYNLIKNTLKENGYKMQEV